MTRWGAFADDQLGLLDHLGVRRFFFFGNCIGGSFALKLMERAPDRIVAGVLSQPIGHRPEKPGVMYDTSRDGWAKEFRARRPDVSMETIEKYLDDLYRVRVARIRAQLPDADARAARRHSGACLPGGDRCRIAGAERRHFSLSLEGPTRTESADDQPGAQLFEGASPCNCGPLVERESRMRQVMFHSLPHLLDAYTSSRKSKIPSAPTRVRFQ